MDVADAEKGDRATQRRERDARVDAWFSAKLSPEQQQSRKRMDDARTAALTEKLATTAVQGIAANVDLSEDQMARLYETAAAEVARSLDEKAYANSFGLGLKVLYMVSPLPVEEEAGEFVSGILDPGQRELWKAAVERDRTFGESMQKRVIGGVFEQLGKAKPTHEEIFRPFEK